VTRAIVLRRDRPASVELVLRLGAASVTVEAAPYDPVVEEAERLRVHRAAAGAEDVAPLLELLTPGAARALERAAGGALEAAGTTWLAARSGAEAVTGWRGVAGPDGTPEPFTVEAWQLAGGLDDDLTLRLALSAEAEILSHWTRRRESDGA